MQKLPKLQDKHYLKSLHQDIDLYDRKLAHLNKYDAFASDADREAAARKMSGKRELLVQNARRLASEGIEFKSSDLPRSFRAVIAAPEIISAVLKQEHSNPSIWA
jgi:hypothetical protein